MAASPTASSHDADVAVVGAGAAGLYAALRAAREGASVVLISATPLAQTASYWAQGGLAAALAADDSPERHLEDTERAGRYLVRRSAAEVLVNEAPGCVGDLQSLGVRFDADRFGRLALGLEGGHSVRRVVHAGGSATGRRVVRQLSALAVAESRITVLEGSRARALWQRDGACRAVICDAQLVLARHGVLLATGGAAALWVRTTNPPGSQGIGLGLAHAAGAALADLELMQFHPTAVIGVPGRDGFLVTQAIRGEGAPGGKPGAGQVGGGGAWGARPGRPPRRAGRSGSERASRAPGSSPVLPRANRRPRTARPARRSGGTRASCAVPRQSASCST